MLRKNLAPTGYRVLVKLYREKAEKAKAKYVLENGAYVEKTESGLIKSVKTAEEIEKERMREQSATQEAVVVKIGPTAFLAFDNGDFKWYKEGDHVVIAKYAGGIDFVDGDDTYRIIDDKDVFATFDGE